MYLELTVLVMLLGSTHFLRGCHFNYKFSKLCVRPMGKVKHAFLVTVAWLKVLIVAISSSKMRIIVLRCTLNKVGVGTEEFCVSVGLNTQKKKSKTFECEFYRYAVFNKSTT